MHSWPISHQETEEVKKAMHAYSETGPIPVSAFTTGSSYADIRREHLRQKISFGGMQSVTDSEMLELILSQALPDRDVEPLAWALLRRFGDFNQVLATPMDELMTVEGVDQRVVTQLRIVQSASQKLGYSPEIQQDVQSDWSLGPRDSTAIGAQF